jgi:predicted short-subunit dehydrogenase-like oxidoreductase (DUF2520 family)
VKPAKEQTRPSSRKPRQPNKPSIAIIGAGRLGTALGFALRASGHTINIAITRSPRSARRASQLLGSKAASIGSNGLGQLSQPNRQLIQQSDVILIATPDDSISQVAIQLRTLLDHPGTGGKRKPSTSRSAAFHTSGALTSKVLDPIREPGLATGSIHPLTSVSSQDFQASSFSHTHFAVEGDPAAIRLGKQLVRDLGGDSFVIDAERKPLYHAAALMASPNLTALVDIAIEMLTLCGISTKRARHILLPLINSTIENLACQDPRQSLTGTFKRGDIATVRMHLAAIASERLTEAMQAYITLGKRSLKLSSLTRTKRLAIESLLDGALTDSPKR